MYYVYEYSHLLRVIKYKIIKIDNRRKENDDGNYYVLNGKKI